MKQNLNQGSERGSVAVEFALIFPMFIAVMAMMFSVGMGMWARYQMLNYATAAARFCAFKVPAIEAEMAACVANTVDNMVNVAKPPCTNLTRNTFINNSPAPGNQAMKLLTVQIDCRGSWLPGTTAMGGNGPAGQYLITARSAMPFIPQTGH